MDDTRKVGTTKVQIFEDDENPGTLRFEFVLEPEQVRQFLQNAVLSPAPSTRQGHGFFDDLDFTLQDKGLAKPPKPKIADPKDLVLIRGYGVSDRSVVNIAVNVLGIPKATINVNHVAEHFAEISAAAFEWLNRKISKKYLALYVSSAVIPPIGPMLFVTGLADDKHQWVLHAAAGKASDLGSVFETLIKRGLDIDQIKLVLLGLDKEIGRAVRQALPNVKLQVCWQAVETLAPPNLRKEIRDLRDSSDAKEFKATKLSSEATAVLKPFEKVLTNYQMFSQDLWRALRVLIPNYRLEEKLKRLFKSLKTKEEIELLFIWTILRFQYQWSRIPVDSAQLDNLRWIKEKNKVLSKG